MNEPRIRRIAMKIASRAITAAVTSDYITQVIQNYGLDDRTDIFYPLLTAIQSLQSNLQWGESISERKKTYLQKLFGDETFHAEDMEVTILTSIMGDDFDDVAYNVGIYRTFKDEVETVTDDFNEKGATDPEVYKEAERQSRRFTKLSGKIDGVVDTAKTKIEAILGRFSTSRIVDELNRDLGQKYGQLYQNDSRIQDSVDSMETACENIGHEIVDYLNNEIPQLQSDIAALDASIKNTQRPSKSNGGSNGNGNGGSVANKAGRYKGFTGTINVGNTNATVSDATFKIQSNGDVTWDNGTWEDGTWNNGTWRNGTWEKGTWNGGTWEKGDWEDGTWNDGDWEDGTWHKGTWKDGVWYGGKWNRGTWENGQDRRNNVHPRNDSPDNWTAMP